MIACFCGIINLDPTHSTIPWNKRKSNVFVVLQPNKRRRIPLNRGQPDTSVRFLISFLFFYGTVFDYTNRRAIEGGKQR